MHGVPAGWAPVSHAVAFGGPQARVLGRAGGGLGEAGLRRAAQRRGVAVRPATARAVR